MIHDPPRSGASGSGTETSRTASPGPEWLCSSLGDAWPDSLRRYPAGAALGQPEAPSPRRGIVLSGWALETRLVGPSRRRISSFILPGEPIVPPARCDITQRAIVSLTRLEIAELVAPEARLRDIVDEAISEREDRVYDQMVRLGRLDAKQAVLNLLLELHDRLAAAGLAKDGAFRLPITQETFAEAAGVSLAHLNRVLSRLRSEGHLLLGCGRVTILASQTVAEDACYRSSTGAQMRLAEACA
jgi:CRP-like cAMP-binding protein